MIDEIGKDKLEDPRPFGGEEEQATPEDSFNTDEGEPATEEEQTNYDLLVIRARKMMFGDSREKILTMLGASEKPSKGIGKVLRQSAKENGRDITDEVAVNAGSEIGEDLSDLAKSAGVFKYDSEEDEISELQDAMLYGVKAYGDGMIQSGEITPEIQAQAAKVTKEGNQREYDNAPKPKEDKLRTAVNKGIVSGAAQKGE